MKQFKNIDTGEIWSEEEIRTEYNNFREESEYMRQFDSFEDYLEDQIRLGKSGESGLYPIWCTVQKTSAEIIADYRAELRRISEGCVEEGYPSTGSNYELRVEGLWERYYAEDYRTARLHEIRINNRIKSAVIKKGVSA